MKNKAIIMLAAIILVLPIRGCKKEVLTPSIVHFDCRTSAIEKQIPALPNVIMAANRCDDWVFDTQKLSEAVHIFAREYSESFDLEKQLVINKLAGLKITVSAIPRTVRAAYDINGKFLEKEVPVNGLALDKNNIWVEVKTSKIHHSALAHELVHIIIWRDQVYHGDPDHEGEQFSGWSKKHTALIKKVNSILLDLDI